MAFRKKYINEILGTVLVLSALLSTASAVDCFGKSFHCVNSTHFMICVDLGGGVSQSIDDFLIPCPPPTVCQGNNHFECEFPAVSTPSATLSNVISETTEPWNEIEMVVTTNTPPKNTSTTKEYSEKYMNTVSITNFGEDNSTINTTVDITTEAYFFNDVNNNSNLSEIVPISPIYEATTKLDETTVDITTEADFFNDVNNNSNISEIVPISPIYEATTKLDEITQVTPVNIATGVTEVTTNLPEIIPLHEIKNVANKTNIDIANKTLSPSVTKPTDMFNNNFTVASNNLEREVQNITLKRIIQDDVVTPDTLLIEQPLTTITDENLVTGVDPVATTTQSLVSTDGLLNSLNINIQTTTSEPVIIKDTIGIEQFQKTTFEEYLTTDSVQNFATEQSTVLATDEKNVMSQLPVTTYQSTATTFTSINVKDEATVETTIGSEQPTTTIYEDNFSTTGYGIYTTEAPLTIATYEKQDKRNTDVLDQIPTKLTNNTVFYMSVEPATDINSLPTTVDVTTEQSIVFTTETQDPFVAERPKINMDSSATEKAQRPDLAGFDPPKSSQEGLTTNYDAIIENPSNIAMEKQKQLRTKQITITENITTTDNNVTTEGIILPTEAKKPMGEAVEQSVHVIKNLITEYEAVTKNPSELTTETTKPVEPGQLTTNKNSSGNDMITEVSVLTTTEAQNPIHKGAEQQKISTTSSVTENTSDFTTVTQRPIHTSTEQPITIKSDLLIDVDITTEKANIYTTIQHKPTEQFINEKLATNKNSTVIDDDAVTVKVSGYTAKTRKPISTSTEQPITNKDAIPEDISILSKETQKSIYSNQQPTTNKTLATEIDLNVEKASHPAAATQKSTFMNTDKSTTIKVITKTVVDLATETSKQTILTQKEAAIGFSDQHTVTEQQKQESLIADTTVQSTTEEVTTPYAKIITDVTDVVTTQRAGVTDKPIGTNLRDNTETDTKTYNITERRNYTTLSIEPTATKVEIITNTITSTEPTTLKTAEDKLKEETTSFISSTKASNSGFITELPVANVHTVKNIIIELPYQDAFEVTTNTDDRLIPSTESSLQIKNDVITSTAEPTLLMSNGHKSDLTNLVTTETSLSIQNEINTPVIKIASSVYTGTKFDMASAIGINEGNYPSKVISTTHDIESVDENQLTTESNLEVNGTAFITKETKAHNNSNSSDVGISTAAMNEHIINTDIVNSGLYTTKQGNLIPVQDISEHVAKQLPVTETLDLISNFNINQVNDSLDSSVQGGIHNESKQSNSTYSGQLPGTEVTSETTATENFTPSLKPINENSLLDQHKASENQLATENSNIVTDNLAHGTSSFTTTRNTILKEQDDGINTMLTENGKNYNTFTSVNLQDNAHVSLTTENLASSHDYENTIHETLQLTTQVNDFISNPVYVANNDVDDFTTIKGVIENTGTTSTETPTTIGSIDFELRVSNKNDIVQQFETTPQPIDNGQPMKTNEPNNNEFEHISDSNPYSNILLDKINQADKTVIQGSQSFAVENDGNINGVVIFSATTNSTTENSSAQQPQIQNTNDVTTQAFIPLVQTNGNLPPSQLDSLPVTDDLQKTSQTATMMKTDDSSAIQPKNTNLKETPALKELFSNSGTVLTPSAILMTDSTTEFSIRGAQNLDKTTESYFDTPSETSTSVSFIIEADSSKYSTESSLIGNNNKYDPLISKLEHIPIDINLLPHVTTDYSKITKNDISTEASKIDSESNIKLNQPVISEAGPNYKIKINTVDINKSTPNASQGTKTSETNIPQEPFNSATSYHLSNNYQYVTEKRNSSSPSKISNVNISSEASSSQKTDANSVPWQSKEQNVAIKNIPQNNSSFYTDEANSGSKSTINTEFKNVSQSTGSKSSHNFTNTANKQRYPKSQTDSAVTASQVTENFLLQMNTTKAVNSDINGNTLQKNNSIGSWTIFKAKNSTITVTAPMNMSQNNNKIGSALIRNSTNTTNSNTRGDFKSQQKTTNLTEHTIGQIKTTTSTTSQASTTKIMPRTVAPTTTTVTQNPSKQILKAAAVNYSCTIGTRGRHSDKDDCRKFYICFGTSQPIVGNCPANTVFSDISKLCTKNLSHCIRENEFKCPSAGRFSDLINDNDYYICVSHKNHLYRFKFQCQKGFTLNKTTIRCIENRKIESNKSISTSLSENSRDGSTSSSTSSSSSSMSTSSDSSSTESSSSTSTISDSSSTDSSSGTSTSSDSSSTDSSSNVSSKDNSRSNDRKASKSKEKPEEKEDDEEDEVFKCEKEGKFPVRNDCRRYYLCKKNGKSEYRRKIKKCESGDVFHKGKKKSKESSESSDSESHSDGHHSRGRQRKEKKEEHEDKEEDEQKVFQCETEGKFPVPGDCRRYYLCNRSRKSVYRRKIKKCDSDEVFHKSKKKCVDAESYEC